MNLKQKLTSLAIVTMPMMPIVDFTILTTTTSSNAEVSNATPKQKVAQSAATPPILGKTWEGEDKKFRVQFYQKGNTYNGKIVGLAPGAEPKDVKNPDPKLRSRNLIGSTMLQGYSYDPATKQLTGGVVYIPEMGKLLKPKLKVISEERIEMQVSMGFMSRTLALTAVK